MSRTGLAASLPLACGLLVADGGVDLPAVFLGGGWPYDRLEALSLAAALGALSVAVGPVPAAAQPAAGAVATVEAVQGTVVRWSVPGTKRCAMGRRSWAALQETCYYPIDMEHAPGRIGSAAKA